MANGGEELQLQDMVSQLKTMGISTEGIESKEDCIGRLLEFKAKLDAKETPLNGEAPPPQLPAVLHVALSAPGGRRVDKNGVNAGALRCPRCMARLVSKKAMLVERNGDVKLAGGDGAGGEDKHGVAETGGLPLAVPQPDGTWQETRYRWWWRLADHNDFDNVAMSHFHETPNGKQRYPLCPECMFGPLGLQNEINAEVLLSCELVTQQDFELAIDALDFRAPEGVDINSLRQIMASGMGSVTFPVTFAEQRLGLQIQDVEDEPGATEVAAFTEQDGVLGPAEVSGKIEIGDRIARVNGQSCLGLDYAAVLDLIITGDRPVTIVFERNGRATTSATATDQARVPHEELEPARTVEAHAQAQ